MVIYIMKYFLYLLLLFVADVYGKPFQTKATCGYEACPKADPNKLNVHIVPHSHDDVGWLKTVDQYYYGSEFKYQRAGVQYIINSVLRSLNQNPERRFIQVETAFLHKWWLAENEKSRAEFQKFINNGQIEIVGGAWSMNDESDVHYQPTIDQFTLGLRLLNDTLGECARPKVAWQIDPFGHTKEMASTFARFGFDGLFFSRLDWRDKTQRLTTKTAEMIWKGSDSLGNESSIFTSVLYNHYSAPKGFCFDVLCQDDPIIDDKESPDYNWENKVKDFTEFIQTQASYYTTNNIIITMGDDFNYQDALSYYHNLDKLIKGFQIFEQSYENKTINVFYSTPSCYLKAVNEDAIRRNLDFPVKSDDFIPYATDFHTYWSGYYTSRPTSKRYERQGNNLLQVAKQISAFQGVPNFSVPLKEAMGIMQHHDAITGTEKQHVADDYHRILSAAVDNSSLETGKLISNLVNKDSSKPLDLNFTSCILSNVSYCSETKNDNFVVAIYNPLSRTISHYVHLPVDTESFEVTNPKGEAVVYQITPSIHAFDYIPDIKPSKFNLVFHAENIPPLGLQIYKFKKTTVSKAESVLKEIMDTRDKLGDENLGVEINESSGLLSSITVNKTAIDITQNLLYYVSAVGNNQVFENRSSGAYIFRPKPNTTEAGNITDKVEFKTYKGPLLEEVHQVFSNWSKQIIRVYKKENYVEFDWLVGPLEVYDGEDFGREVISRFTTKLDSKNVFYTDSNGREMLKRIRNYRPTYNYSDEEPISGNYYPITAKILLNDEATGLEFAVLNDRAQGGSSLKSGELELMLHRRCMRDDAFGVGEQLNEIQYNQGLVARGQHYVTFGKTANGAAAVQRDIVQRKLLAPWVFVSKTSDLNQLDIKTEFSGIKESLPKNVQILTLETVGTNLLLLRLEHIFEKNEDPLLSQNVTINIKELFTQFDLISLRETTLAGNQWKSENKRFSWKEGKPLETAKPPPTDAIKERQEIPKPKDEFDITLAPMEVVSFVLQVKYK